MSKVKLKHSSGNSMSIAAPATNPASDLEIAEAVKEKVNRLSYSDDYYDVIVIESDGQEK